MEGALPSVVGGLVGVPLVAVPTSVGYGASFGGVAALLAMLNSCAPGVTVVNIDNGYGAGVFAARVARRAGPMTSSTVWVDASSGASRRHAARRTARRRRAARDPAAGGRRPRTRAGRRCGVEAVSRNGFAATRCHVEVADSVHHRTWRDIRALLLAADLDDDVRDRAVAAFERLAVAEATVHGSDPLDVSFHEVGALDAIADVVGGLRRVRRTSTCDRGRGQPGRRRLRVGPGAHGTLPVPPPGRRRAAPRRPVVRRTARCARDGALHARPAPRCSPPWRPAGGPQPAMTVGAIGVGAGGRDPEGHANVLRLLVGSRGRGARRAGRC